MEDGVKGDTAKPKEATFRGKAGWVKKSSGKFLASYKDRYIQVEKTEIAVYESEELNNCLERVDLENYDKCHELRSAFKKRNRLVLIRAPKDGNKVQDVKFQAQDPEDKEAWIKALSDGISRAKNKIFDEVKVDETCSLEHVTRTRPKGNQGRRPPTRIHMKGVANLSSDGILKSGADGDALDVVDNTPNGTHQVNTEVETAKEAVKPPMPPSKLSESPQDMPDRDASDTSQKKVLKPPMPPSKENKPSVPSEMETPKEAEPAAPPVPPNKPRNSSEEPDAGIIPAPSPSPSPPSRDPLNSPTPPSKDKKPAQAATEEVEEEAPQISSGTENKEEESIEGMPSDTQLRNGSDKTGSEGHPAPSSPKKALKPSKLKLGSSVPEEPGDTSTEREGLNPALTAPDEEQEESDPSSVALEAKGDPALAIASGTDTQRPAAPLTKSTEPFPESVKKSPGPPAPPKKKPLKHLAASDLPCDFKEGSIEVPASTGSKSVLPPDEKVSAVAWIISDGPDVSKHDEDLTPPIEPRNETEAFPSPDDKGDSTLLPEHAVHRVKPEELKSSDSCQCPGNELEGGDSTKASAPVVVGCRACLHDDVSEAEAEPADDCVSQEGKAVQGERSRAQVLQKVQMKRRMQPAPPPLPDKPQSKEKSVSMADLLSESVVKSREWPVKELCGTSPGNGMIELRSKVALELENTVELLDSISSRREMQGGLGGGGEQKGPSPEELLTKAVEKLRKADQFLQEARSLQQANPLEKIHRRTSW